MIAPEPPKDEEARAEAADRLWREMVESVSRKGHERNESQRR